MSGIVGIVHLDGAPVGRELLERMTRSLAFRGPDGQETWLEDPVGFGHALLRTTDEAESERQPFSRDGEVWITADVRLDGRRDLIDSLCSKGVEGLQGAPDVELLLAAYQVWNENCLEHLLGDFAFAIWDGRRNRLFCARDPLGTRQFYYARKDGLFLFSNTLNCLREHPAVRGELNDLAVADFLLFGVKQDPAATTFADIQRLPPAHRISLNRERFDLCRFWDFPREEVDLSTKPEEWTEQFLHWFGLAVGDRLRTQRAGVFMSGGLDSSSIAALAEQSLGKGVKAFTGIYESLMEDQERRYAALVADHLGISIDFIAGDGIAPFQRWDDARTSMPEPVGYPMLAFDREQFRAAAGHAPVALDGDGGDEILFPSASYLWRLLGSLRLVRVTRELLGSSLRSRSIPPLPLGIRGGLRRWMNVPDDSPLPAWISPALQDDLGLEERRAEAVAARLPRRERSREAERRLTSPILQFLLEYYDAGVTAVPVEVRYPFLDTRLIRFLLKVPSLPWLVDKHLLRQSMKTLLPAAIRRRRKAPLPKDPLARLLRHPETCRVNGLQPRPGLEKFVLLERLPPPCEERSSAGADRLWTDLRPWCLNLWLGRQRAGL